MPLPDGSRAAKILALLKTPPKDTVEDIIQDKLLNEDYYNNSAVSDDANNKDISDTFFIEDAIEEPVVFTDLTNCGVPLILPSSVEHSFEPVQNVIIEEYVFTSTDNIHVQENITLEVENMVVENNVISTVENNQIQIIISEPDTMQVQEVKTTEENSHANDLTKLGKIRQRKSKDMTKVTPNQKQKAKHPVRTACECTKECIKKIPQPRRESINSQFWDMTWLERRLYVLKCCIRKPVKRRTLGEITARKNSIVYTLDGERNESSHIVCKTFFLTTLGFTKNNNTLLKNLLGANYESNNLLPKKDMRGKFSHKRQLEERQHIKLHVESYHPSVSHYRREHAPLRRYLPSDISIKEMYSNFVVQNPVVKCSYERYRLIVSNDMKISFTKLGHEECEQCEYFSQHHPNHKKDALNPDCDNCLLWNAHINRAREARESYRRDVKRAESPDNHTIFFSADLQKVIMLPRIDTFKSVCFTKRIVAFNESFVPLTGKGQQGVKPLGVIWHEGIAGRSKEDIISAFYAFFLNYRDAEHIVLWLDNCSAQNKNWALLSFLIFIVNSDDVSLNTLELNFFEPRHTFMSADSFHHQVELSMKRMGKLYDFSDFKEAVRECNLRKVDVKSMEPPDFFEWRDYASQYKLKKQNPRRYLNDIVQVIARRGDHNLSYRNDFCGPVGPLLQLNFLANKAYKEGIQIPPSRTSHRGIDKDKKNGILTKLLPLMPENRKQFWRDIPVHDVPDLNTSIED